MQYKTSISVVLFVRAENPEIENVLRLLPYPDEEIRSAKPQTGNTRTLRKVVAGIHNGAAEDVIDDLEHQLVTTKVAEDAVFEAAKKWVIVRVHDADFVQINLSGSTLASLYRHGLALAIENHG